MLTVILSITAIVISCVSLAWQVATWVRSGPVITVTVSQAMPTYGPGMGTIVGEPHVGVTAANSGRSPITVKNWGGLKLADGRTLAVMGGPPGRRHCPAAWNRVPMPRGMSRPSR